MSDEFLTVAEIAEMLKVNGQTVRNWLDHGDLQGVRVGARRVRVRQSDLDQFLEAGKTGTDDAEVPGADLDELAVAAWAELGIALADATAALGDQDRQRLAGALASLAEAARGLSGRLDPKQ